MQTGETTNSSKNHPRSTGVLCICTPSLITGTQRPHDHDTTRFFSIYFFILLFFFSLSHFCLVSFEGKRGEAMDLFDLVVDTIEATNCNLQSTCFKFPFYSTDERTNSIIHYLMLHLDIFGLHLLIQ